jgi:hypothetical protein
VDPAAWLVAIAAAVALMTAFVLRTRLPVPFAFVILALCGAGGATGCMLLLNDPSSGEFIAAVVTTAVLVPFHVRIVLGPLGPSGRGQPWRAAVSAEELQTREHRE